MHASLLSFTENLLDLAALNDQVDMMISLKQIGHAGACRHALIWATEFGHVATVRFLVDDQDEPTIGTCARRHKAAMVADSFGHREIAQVLREPKGIIQPPPCGSPWRYRSGSWH
ncbi:Aste57867_21633 [Aphanomyces stellatus]|uniref:Aste57867_21633 protein n=1 Tax=Aphanomyces stellatus TaxID=120398 RepID=A0A485LIP1_9STRA|nr:hypothetical protein As57867_021564 [Aphanomyces stellatus]VFT98303.1 Aste57867_21633 [Aphanomyces stellatus]